MADDDMLDQMNKDWANRRLEDYWVHGGPRPTAEEYERIGMALMPQMMEGTPEWAACHDDDYWW